MEALISLSYYYSKLKFIFEVSYHDIYDINVAKVIE
jgi:hypothetical protein